MVCPWHIPKLCRTARRLAATVQTRNNHGFDSGRTRGNGEQWTHLRDSLEVESQDLLLMGSDEGKRRIKGNSKFWAQAKMGRW